MLPSMTMGKKNPIYFGNISHLMHLEFLGNLGSIRKKKKKRQQEEGKKEVEEERLRRGNDTERCLLNFAGFAL